MEMSRIRQRLSDRDGPVTRPSDNGINAIPINPLYDAAYHHMHNWLSERRTPPIQPRVQFSDDGEVLLDDHGIAKGGMRLPQADVPLAQNSAITLSEDIFEVLGGSSQPFSSSKLQALYGSRENFLWQFAYSLTSVNIPVISPIL